MKISLQWINEFVDVADYMENPAPLATLLTQSGLEVEEIQNFKSRFNFVVVGQILEKEMHPQADKLTLCQVAIGKGEVQQIVCGAKNHKKGDVVVVALPGAVLPGDFAIKVSTIRGIQSSGMLCSVKELGLASESDGILILPTDATVGMPFAEYYGLNDVVFELKVTPNRADCLSHFGLAREIAALTGRTLKVKPVEKIEGTATPLRVEIVDNNLCPRYTGRYFKDIQVGPSPDWLRRRLEAVGMKSINNIVDTTNYIMMEWGQPLHAFDANTIKGGVLRIGPSHKNEKFTTFDKTELTLLGDELTIRDSEKALCIAGVVGSPESGVTVDTKNLFLESAYFSSSSLRRTSRRFGLQTDAAYRFMRGVDPAMTRQALERATELLARISKFSSVSVIEDAGTVPENKRSINLSLQTVTDRLGYEAEKTKLEDIFKRLGCELTLTGTDQWSIIPPSYRSDLDHEMDMVEEYARVNGYEHIPETLPASSVKPASHDAWAMKLQKVREILQDEGFSESLHMIFSPEKKSTEFYGENHPLKVFTGETLRPVRLLNPLSEEMAELRTTLAYGLVETCNKNFHQGNESGALFEVGRVFNNKENGYQEFDHLALCGWGQNKNLWNKNQDVPPVFQIKTALESLFSVLGKKYRFIHSPSVQWAQTHPGQTTAIEVEGKIVGYLASVHPQWLDANKIRVPVAIAEIYLPGLLNAKSKAFKFASLLRFPKVERDFSFLVPESVKAGDIMQVLKAVSGDLYVNATVFDLYHGENMKNGERSLAFRLSLQDAGGTLQEAQLQKIQDEVFKKLRDKSWILN